MTTPRDEVGKRRPEFTEGHALTLGDGQQWTFPRALLRWYPAPQEDGTFKPKRSPPYGPEYQSQLERLMSLDDETEDAQNERHELRLLMAATLLSRNYQLDESDYEVLLPLEYSAENAEMWRSIYYILMGVGVPKR